MPTAVFDRIFPQALAELRRVIHSSHCGQLPDTQLAGMLSIQQQRDVRMGQALRDAPTPALLLAGNYHVRQDLGIPLHLEGMTPVVVRLHEAGEPLPRADQADYLWLTPAAPEQDHCAQWQQSGD